MKKKELVAGSRPVSLFLPEGRAACPVVYAHLASDQAEETAALLENTGAALAAVGGVDWNRDLSPWRAPAAFRGGGDFAGGADEYLSLLTETILPAVEGALGFIPAYRAVAGYSMAGLFALYAVFRTGCFARAACISGSLWFDGFAGFVAQNRPVRTPERVYLSLGDREARTKNRRLAAVESATREVGRRLCELGVPTIGETNPGGHFDAVVPRTAKGIRRLVE